MSKRVTQSYAPEFRAEAIKLVLEQGFSAAEAAARLNMNQGTLAYWVTQARKASKNTSAKAGTQSAAELAAENKQLRKELAEARMERDILMAQGHVEKATASPKGISCGAYFARESHCPVRVREAMAIPLSGQAAVPGSGCISLRVLRLVETATLPSRTGE